MVRISTLLTTAVIALSTVGAVPAQYFGGRLAGIANLKNHLKKRDVFIETLGGGEPNGQIPLRREFSAFIEDQAAMNLYLLALQRMQQTPQDDPESYFQVAGIHGRPYMAWDNVRGGNNNGPYCSHGDMLFLSWHRPYLALYENILFNHVQTIASEYTDEGDRSRYQAAARVWRIPYWDWASQNRFPHLIGNAQRIPVHDPARGSIDIDNPLYSYNYAFPSSRVQQEQFVHDGFNNRERTRRANYNQINEELANNAENLKNRVYNLLTAYDTFADVSHTGQPGTGRGDSLESVHNVIHGIIGGADGEMTFLDYAAMDNLFFLHHANLDRLFAIWQATHPNSYLTPNDNYRTEGGTFGIPAGTRITSNTDLSPFRSSATDFYTSEEVRSTKSLGYMYPETVDWDKSAEQYIPWVNEQINQIYGAGSPAGMMSSLTSITESMTSTTAPPSTSTSNSVIVTSSSSPSSQEPISTAPSTTATAPTPTDAVALPIEESNPETSTVAPITTPSNLPVDPPVNQPNQPGPNTGNQDPEDTCAENPFDLWKVDSWKCFDVWWRNFSGSRRRRGRNSRHHDKRDIVTDTIKNYIDDVVEDTIEVIDNTIGIVENAIDTIPPIRDLVPIADSLISGGDRYIEYIAHLKVDNGALNETFKVFFFLGDYDHTNAKGWAKERNMIGMHVAFSNRGPSHHFTGSGSVPLTASIMHKVATGDIMNMGRPKVVPYLKEHLRWEVATASNVAVPSDQVKDLKVTVLSAGVKLPCSQGEVPLWGRPNEEYTISEGIDGVTSRMRE